MSKLLEIMRESPGYHAPLYRRRDRFEVSDAY